MFKYLLETILRFIFQSFYVAVIFQNTFVLMAYFLVKRVAASICISGVMVITIVEMDPTRKIAVVRMFFIFPFL